MDNQIHNIVFLPDGVNDPETLTPVEIVRAFGGKRGYESALMELKQHLYE